MRKIRELTIDEFKAFTEACESKNYMQSAKMFKRYSDECREEYLLGLVNEKDEILVAGLSHVIYERFGKKVFTFSRGPIIKDGLDTKYLAEFLNESKRFFKTHGGMVFQVSLNLLTNQVDNKFMETMEKNGFKRLGEYEQVKWTYVLDFAKVEGLPVVPAKKERVSIGQLNLDPEAEQKLFLHLRSSHRRYIRYAENRYNVTVRELRVAEYDVLQRLLEASGKAHGFAPRSQKFFEQLLRYFGDDVVAIVAELPDKTPIAAAFFVLYGNEVIYLSGGFDREHKKLGAPHLVQWTMIKYAYVNGYKQYNFWGTNPDPNDGVFQFKEGFHGEVQEFVDTFMTGISPLGLLYTKKIRYAKHRDL